MSIAAKGGTHVIRGKHFQPGTFLPSQAAPTTYSFPVRPPMNLPAQPAEEGRTHRSSPTAYQLSLSSPTEIEIGHLLCCTVSAKPPLPAEATVLWHILKGPPMTPHQVGPTSVEYLVPSSDELQIRIAAEVCLPGTLLPPVEGETVILGTTLGTMIKSFQELVRQGHVSPRFTKRLADHLFKAQQAQAMGDRGRVNRSLTLIASDCATVLKKKSDLAVMALYHQARWLLNHRQRP